MLFIPIELELLRDVPGAVLSSLLQRGRRYSFPSGRRLLSQDDLSDSLHVVLKGSVRVERSHKCLVEPVVLAKLGPGAAAGGFWRLNQQPCLVAVWAIEETETVELTSRALAEAVVRSPEASPALLHRLSRRLPGIVALVEEMAGAGTRANP